MRRLPALGLLVLAISWAGLARGDEPAAPLSAKDMEPLSDWYGLYLKDPNSGANKKMGYCRITREHDANGAIREAFQLVMKIISFNQKVELTMTQALVFEAKPPYRLVRGEYNQGDGKVNVKMTIERAGDKFKVVHEAGGETKIKEQEEINYTLRDSTAIERWMRQGPKVGAKLESKDFNMQELALEPQTSTVKSQKAGVVNGVPVRFYEVETASKQLTMLSRYDSDGRMLSGKFALFDLQLETEEQAKNAQYSQDLFVLGMVKIDRPIGLTREVRALVINVSGLDDTQFEDGPRQVFLPGKEKGTATIKLGKSYGKEMKADAKEIEENLKETLAYPITHPKIKALAKKAVGDATAPEEKVKRIVNFVHDYIQPNLSASMPNIHDLIQRRKGDCKSYALLCCTLARAAGVPAREVSGLLYIGDDTKSFGGHAWNEVVLNGVWVPVDASMAETDINATHISFGTQDRAARGLLETLGKLSFRLVEVRSGE